MNQVNEIIAAIGKAGRNPDGSYTRSLFSEEFFEAERIVGDMMKQFGMSVETDAAGNIHGRLEGTDDKAKSILMGSHLDTVQSGGLFDGVYGVSCALETVRRLQENGIRLRHPIEIYGFNGEESNPLGGTFGSRALAGVIDEKQLGLAKELQRYGRSVQEIMDCARDFSDVKCYLEPHIEQGDRLFTSGQKIGVVSGIVGIFNYSVVAHGRSNHAGTTMMKNRRDAMVAMAKLIVEADRCCREIDDTLVLTVGTIDCKPNAVNVIPGRVECSFEMRHMDPKKTDQLIEKIREIAATIETADFEITKTLEQCATDCDPHLVSLIDKTAEKLGISHVIMPSGAGHDANAIAHRVPMGMIFVPSRDGLSHCGEEWTDPQDLETGADLLYQTVLELDQEA